MHTRSTETITPQSPIEMIDPQTHLIEYLDSDPYTAAWVIRNAEGSPSDIEHAVLFAQGWTAPSTSLVPLALETTLREPGTVAVIAEQPRLNAPHELRLLPEYVRELRYADVGNLRTDTVLRAGSMACKRFGLDTLALTGHSLGSVDVTHATTSEDRDFEVGDLTLLAPAGLLHGADFLGVIARMPTSHCPQSSSRKVSRENMLQVGMEAAYALHESIVDELLAMRGGTTNVSGVDFARDKMFVRNGRPYVFDETHYTVVHEGCACHSAPNHPSEAGRIIDAIESVEWRLPVPASSAGTPLVKAA